MVSESNEPQNKLGDWNCCYYSGRELGQVLLTTVEKKCASPHCWLEGPTHFYST